MAAFAQVFPWCSPDVFWRLTWSEYQVLGRIVKEAQRE